MLKHPESPPASAAPGSSGGAGYLAQAWRPFLGVGEGSEIRLPQAQQQ